MRLFDTGPDDSWATAVSLPRCCVINISNSPVAPRCILLGASQTLTSLDATGNLRAVDALLPVLSGGCTMPELRALRIGGTYKRIRSEFSFQSSEFWPEWITVQHVAAAFPKLEVLFIMLP